MIIRAGYTPSHVLQVAKEGQIVTTEPGRPHAGGRFQFLVWTGGGLVAGLLIGAACGYSGLVHSGYSLSPDWEAHVVGRSGAYYGSLSGVFAWLLAPLFKWRKAL